MRLKRRRRRAEGGPRAKHTRANNFTTGKVHDAVITKERRGEHLGATIQVIPHVTDEIKTRLVDVAQRADVAIVEIGGTVGDIESLPFLEAVRQLRHEVGPCSFTTLAGYVFLYASANRAAMSVGEVAMLYLLETRRPGAALAHADHERTVSA